MRANWVVVVLLGMAFLLAGCQTGGVVYETAVPTDIDPVPTDDPFVPPVMVLVPAGSFEMGSVDGHANEAPPHVVQISRPFLVSRSEVTWGLYDQFCLETGRSIPAGDPKWGIIKGPDYPATASWYDAVALCNWLSEKEGLTPAYSGSPRRPECDFASDGYRLPTEAEWEYAAGGGQFRLPTLYSGGDEPEMLAWYAANSDLETHPVELKEANELGLFDLGGNAWEWCWDWYDPDYYAVSPAVDPNGAESGDNRVRRGGNCLEGADALRVTYRSIDLPRIPLSGIRLVRTVVTATTTLSETAEFR